MAANNRISIDENTRKKIKAGMLIKRLTDHALSDEDMMSTSQVNAAKILLGKTLPDLSNVDIQAGVELDGKLEITWAK